MKTKTKTSSEKKHEEYIEQCNMNKNKIELQLLDLFVLWLL